MTIQQRAGRGKKNTDAKGMKGGEKQKMKKRVESNKEKIDRTYDRSINNLITYAMMSYLPIFCLVLFTPIRELEDDITYDLGVKDEKTS